MKSEVRGRTMLLEANERREPRQLGSQAARQSGSQAARQPGSQVARQPGSQAALACHVIMKSGSEAKRAIVWSACMKHASHVCEWNKAERDDGWSACIERAANGTNQRG